MKVLVGPLKKKKALVGAFVRHSEALRRYVDSSILKICGHLGVLVRHWVVPHCQLGALKLRDGVVQGHLLPHPAEELSMLS